jgi:hypothetical protein
MVQITAKPKNARRCAPARRTCARATARNMPPPGKGFFRISQYDGAVTHCRASARLFSDTVTKVGCMNIILTLMAALGLATTVVAQDAKITSNRWESDTLIVSGTLSNPNGWPIEFVGFDKNQQTVTRNNDYTIQPDGTFRATLSDAKREIKFVKVEFVSVATQLLELVISRFRRTHPGLSQLQSLRFIPTRIPLGAFSLVYLSAGLSSLRYASLLNSFLLFVMSLLTSPFPYLHQRRANQRIKN